MPTYEYRCPDGHDFERFYRKISDATGEVTCPVCGKPAERKLSAGAGLVFKGSGFYLTDYGKNAHRGSAPSGSGEGQGGEAKGSSEPKADSGSAPSESKAEKSESKPAAESTKPAEKPA